MINCYDLIICRWGEKINFLSSECKTKNHRCRWKHQSYLKLNNSHIWMPEICIEWCDSWVLIAKQCSIESIVVWQNAMTNWLAGLTLHNVKVKQNGSQIILMIYESVKLIWELHCPRKNAIKTISCLTSFQSKSSEKWNAIQLSKNNVISFVFYSSGIFLARRN